MPHRAPAGESSLDTRLESELGRLFFNYRISKIEYEAGVRYANIVLMYLLTTDAPEPYGRDDLESLNDDVCESRKLNMSAAKAVLKQFDRRVTNAVDRVAVYDQAIRDGELESLRRGLLALAGG